MAEKLVFHNRKLNPCSEVRLGVLIEILPDSNPQIQLKPNLPRLPSDAPFKDYNNSVSVNPMASPP